MRLFHSRNPRVLTDIMRDDSKDLLAQDEETPDIVDTMLDEARVAADVVEEVIESIGNELFPPIQIPEDALADPDDGLDREVAEIFRSRTSLSALHT